MPSLPVPNIIQTLARLRRSPRPQTGPLSVPDLRRLVAQMVD